MVAALTDYWDVRKAAAEGLSVGTVTGSPTDYGAMVREVRPRCPSLLRALVIDEAWAELDDPRAGAYEGSRLDEYRERIGVTAARANQIYGEAMKSLRKKISKREVALGRD